MKKNYLLLNVLIIIVMIFPVSVAYAEDNGVDDLRGRWDVEWELNVGEDHPPPLVLYINDLMKNPYMDDTYIAGGCMRSVESDVFMPLSLSANPDPENGTYKVTVYSTVVPVDWEPFVIRFTGTVEANGNGVTDDEAGGEITTEFATGQWNGIHHDRRRTKCPSVNGFDLGVQADVYAHKDLAYPVPKHYTLYETHTVVVSSGMLVTEPDGSTMVVQEYTDIFSPDVDFIGRFRYLTLFDGAPVSGGTYEFVLLDVFGNPIPGTESTDVWNGCNQLAPVNLTTSETADGDILLLWDAIPDVPGQFEPGSDPQVGFYQIGVSPFQWEGEHDYGANGIKSPSHEIPLWTFTPGDPGQPDGWDYGTPLSEFSDGLYQVQAEAFGEPLYSDGFGLECSVYNSNEQLIMSIDGDQITFEQIATISGQVTNENGDPLAGIDVGACDYYDEENGFCTGVRSNEDGYYTLVVPAGTYRVSAHPESDYLHEFFDETTDWNEASAVFVTGDQPGLNIDFTLTPAGSISGAITDEFGAALEGINVNACEYYEQDGEPSYCNGAQTDVNGNYTITLPGGSYRVFVNGNPGWANEYYDDTLLYEDAAEVSVSLGLSTPGIDFVLTSGGSISGNVFDLDDNPLGGMAVDTEAGGYGTCTDENGFYSLEGLPLGVPVNVVAGRDFCGEHPFEEQTQFDISVGSTSVDFYLGEVSNYYPTLHVVPAHPEIHGHNWNPKAFVTIFVDDDDDLNNGFLFSESKLVTDDNWCGDPCFDVTNVLELPDGISPGYVVTMMDDQTTRVVHTTNLVWEGTDVDTDTVFGTAGPGAWVEVTSHGPVFAIRVVQADGDGKWVADFSTPGTDEFEQDVLDLEPGFHGRSIQFEGGIPDDGTLAYWYIDEPPQPYLNVQPDHMWADSGNWTEGVEVTLSFGSYSAREFASADGNVWFDLSGTDIAPGVNVNITDGSASKDLLVMSASFIGVDDVENTAWGTAPANAWLGIAVVDESGYEDGFFWIDGVQADGAGDWSFDFDDFGQDFDAVIDAWVHVFDEDGDSTLAHLQISVP